MKPYIILLTLTLSAISAIADADNSRFDAIVAEILANNPSVKASKANSEAETLTLRAENNLTDPDIEFEHQWGQRHVGNKWSVSVSQSFDWPGVYRSRREEINSRGKAFNLLYLADVADMRLRIRRTLVDYVSANQQLELANATATNLKTIAAQINYAFEQSDVTVIDYRKINFELVEALSDADAARKLVDELRLELIELNGGKYIDLAELTSLPQITLRSEDDYLLSHVENDPALRAATLMTDASKQAVITARRSSLPGFSIGYIHNVELGDHFNGAKVGVSLPVFSNRHRKAAAIAEAEAACANADETEFAVRRRVMTDYLNVRQLTERIHDYEHLFPDNADASTDYMRLLTKSFEGGQIPLVIYLYEINYYNEARTKYITLLHDRALALLSLARFE